MLARFADINMALAATVAAPAGGWATSLPAANVASDVDPVGAPARCIAPGDLALSRLELVWPHAFVPTQAGVYFHTLSLGARVRITASTLADTTYATPTISTGWQWVYPSLYDPIELEAWMENFLSGTVTSEAVALTRQHLTLPLAPGLMQRMRFEFDDQEHPRPWFDVGFAHVAATLSPLINFDRPRDLTVSPRDQIDVAPSGRRFYDVRAAQRVLSVSWSNLTDAEARRFVDAALRARQVGTVILVPDITDPASTFREAFPATFGKLPDARLSWPGLARTAFTLEERLA
ncbi:MAG: hypothetical protein U1C74_14795 [Phenylobacterium sp.]|nr:hypothetical protein [Phenylobacterium sp.]